MNENLAPSELRYFIRAFLTGTGNPDSLANVNTSEYPNGACCFVIEDQAFWVLDKTSTQAALANETLVPGSGVGRWFRAGTVFAKSPPATLQSSGANSYAVDGNWQISSGNSFALSSPGVAAWALTALGGILTYTGPSRQFLVDIRASLRVGNADAARQVFAVASLNDDQTGVAAAGVAGSQSTTILIGGASADFFLGAHRIVTMVTGDTLRPKLAGPAAATSLSATALTMTVTPL